MVSLIPCRSITTCMAHLNCYWTTHRYTNSRTGHLADWSTHGLDNSRTGQVADWTTRGWQRRLCVLSFRSFGGICETASCPAHELTSARLDQSARCPVRELAIRELAYLWVVQLPPQLHPQLSIWWAMTLCLDIYSHVSLVSPTRRQDNGCGPLPSIVWQYRQFVCLLSTGEPS